jgi:hypothetical protein
MLVEYVAFGTLVIVALVATFIGWRRRRAEAVVDPSATIPFLGDGGASAGHSSTHSHDSGGFHHGGGSDGGGFFDGSGGSHGGGSHGGHGH